MRGFQVVVNFDDSIKKFTTLEPEIDVRFEKKTQLPSGDLKLVVLQLITMNLQSSTGEPGNYHRGL